MLITGRRLVGLGGVMRFEELNDFHPISLVHIRKEDFVKQDTQKVRRWSSRYSFDRKEISELNEHFVKNFEIIKRFINSRYFHKGYFTVFGFGRILYFDIFDDRKDLLTRFPERVYRIEKVSEEKLINLINEVFLKNYINNSDEEILSIEVFFFVSLKIKSSLFVKKLGLKIDFHLNAFF